MDIGFDYVVRKNHACVVETFFVYNRTLKEGTHKICPIIERIACDLYIGTQTRNYKFFRTVTKDKYEIVITPIIIYKIQNAQRYCYFDSVVEKMENILKSKLKQIVKNINYKNIAKQKERIEKMTLRCLQKETEKMGVYISKVNLRITYCGKLPEPEKEDNNSKYLN